MHMIIIQCEVSVIISHISCPLGRKKNTVNQLLSLPVNWIQFKKKRNTQGSMEDDLGKLVL